MFHKPKPAPKPCDVLGGPNSARRSCRIVSLKNGDPLNHDVLWGRGTLFSHPVSVAWNGIGVISLAFETGAGSALAELEERWPSASFGRDDRQAGELLRRVDAWDAGEADSLVICVRATRFQQDVWSALLRIPRGAVQTYRSVARAIGRPNAMRAVGAACAANPVAVLIPCHRVVHANGDRSGYRWGDAVKRHLLTREA